MKIFSVDQNYLTTDQGEGIIFWPCAHEWGGGRKIVILSEGGPRLFASHTANIFPKSHILPVLVVLSPSFMCFKSKHYVDGGRATFNFQGPGGETDTISAPSHT